MSILLTVLLLAFSPAYGQDVPAPVPEIEAPVPAAEEEAPVEEAPKADEAKKELPPVEVPTNQDEAIEDVQSAVNALQTGQWATFGVLLLGLLVFLYNQFIGSKKTDAPETK